MPYSAEQLEQIDAALIEWVVRQEDLSLKLLTTHLQKERAREFLVHGLSRRINMLRHCLDSAFQAVPPAQLEPSRKDMMDAAAFIQTFIVNVYGSLDNLAHIWCHEVDVRDAKGAFINPKFVGLGPRNELVRQSLPDKVQSYLTKCNGWFEYLENYRHALAHRIPLYIPPCRLDRTAQREYEELDKQRVAASQERNWNLANELLDKMDKVGVFEPYIMHSFGERAKPVVFHSQLISDFATVVEVGERILMAIEQRRGAAKG